MTDETPPTKKEKPIVIEVLMEGPSGELYFQPIEATPENLQELIKATTNSVIKHNLQKQLEKLQKEKKSESADNTH
jgi:hypothetical protein